MLTCTLYKTTVQPWEEGDEPDAVTNEVSSFVYTFKELIQLIKCKGLSNRSQEPCDGNPWVWLSSDPEINFCGEDVYYTLHVSDPEAKDLRYWRLATTRHFPFTRKAY